MQRNRRSEARHDRKPGGADTGFTLVELLVVITILGVLAAIVVFAVQGIGDKGRTSSIASDASILRTAEEANCAQHGKYADMPTLVDNKLLTAPSTYHTVSTGSLNTCGTGPDSSFTISDAQTTFVPGKDAVAVGATPMDLAVNSATDMVYVLNTGESPNTVSVIDGSTDTVIDANGADPGTAITVGTGSSTSRIAVDSHDDRIYVANSQSKSISIIDGAHPDAAPVEVPFTFTDGGPAQQPFRMLVDPAEDEVYVLGLDDGSHSLMVVDGADHPSWVDYGANLSPDVGNGPTLALDDRTDTVYIVADDSAAGGNALIAIDGHTHGVAHASLPAETNAYGNIAVDPDTNRIYTTGSVNPTGDTSDIRWRTMVTDGADLSSTTETEESAANPDWDGGMVVNPNTDQAFVLGEGALDFDTFTTPGVIGRFDGATRAYDKVDPATTTNVDFGTSVPERAFVVNPNIDRVYYVAAFRAGDSVRTGGLQAIDGSTFVSTTLAPGRGFAAIAIDTQTNKIYATDPNANTVAVLR